MYCYMEADKCGVWRGVMRVAHIDMRNTSNNCPTPLTQYQLYLKERVCRSTNTTVLSSDSVTSPTNMHVEGCWVHFQCASVCMHALDLSQYTWPSAHNTILGTSWHSTNKVVYCSGSSVHLHQPTHSLWGETKLHTHTVVLHTQQPLQYYCIYTVHS